MRSLLRKVAVALVVWLFGPALIMADNWPDYRGPNCNGATSSQEAPPLHWSESEGVKWKVATVGRGWSTPVIWGPQIWLTAATNEGRELRALCYDRKSGRLIHNVLVFEVDSPESINPLNSYASPSPVIEQGRVYVYFGTYGVAAIDTFGGDVVWRRNDFKLDHKEGPGSSPILFENLLIFHCDGMDVQYVVALDTSNGEVIWKTDRSFNFDGLDPDFRKAYSTPLIVHVAGQPQLVSAGAKAAYGYDVRTGAELWRLSYPGFSNVARPVADNGVVFLNTGFSKPQLWAVQIGDGRVGEESVLWRHTRTVGAKPSPVLANGLLYFVSDKGGVATCLDAATGEAVWTKRLGGNYSASPLYSHGRVYFFSHEGKTTVIRAGREYEELAVNHLDDGFMGSPAAVDGELFLRTKTHLYRIE